MLRDSVTFALLEALEFCHNEAYSLLIHNLKTSKLMGLPAILIRLR